MYVFCCCSSAFFLFLHTHLPSPTSNLGFLIYISTYIYIYICICDLHKITEIQGEERMMCSRGHWRPAEDEKLRELVEQFGPHNWNAIAQKLSGRSGKKLTQKSFTFNSLINKNQVLI